MTAPVSATFAWHVHHDRLVEPLTEPIEVRQAYIRVEKSAHEQEVRLRLLRPVRGVLPTALAQAGQAYAQARQAYADDIIALHAQECPNCPWDGRTILGGAVRA